MSAERMTTTPGTPARPAPVLSVRGLTKRFPVRGGLFARRGKVVHAVEGVDLDLRPGEVTAIIGESGSGKSTVARLIAQLYTPTAGEISLDGAPVRVRGGRALRRYVGQVQLILQDPFGSFNPVHTIAYHLRRVLRIHHRGLSLTEIDARMAHVLAEVNLTPAQQFADKFPHELSGGQRQRISIARALAANPKVLLADEPVSMLDVSIRLGILNLLDELARERNLALLYITHDIASARYFATTASVMYAGELIEGGPAESVTQHPGHPYTRLLIDSAPDPDRPEGVQRIQDTGQPPSLIDPPSGCRFHPRCPFAMERCLTDSPPAFALGEEHWARCWLHEPGGPSSPPIRRAEQPVADPTATPH
ncbi:ABC transporter ATP-binding protein [Pseudolysinimonas kribbensis]|uniref:ABC transporter ATP-binding protein n=1 Tax=Pseudolysinimonas kribbensis TaxID=433641 RepID=UPI0031DB4A17